MDRWTRSANRRRWEELNSAVRNSKWEEVSSLLRNCNYKSDSIEQFVTACEMYRIIHVNREILSHCSSEQKDRLLKITLRTKTWEEVDILLQDSNYSSSSVDKIVTAYKRYGGIHVSREILSHCSSEQKNRLLKTAWELCRGDGDNVERWNDVKILLQDSNYSSSSVEQFVAACEKFEVMHVDGEILSHCSSEQRIRLLKTALKSCRGKWRWGVVKGLLQDCNYSSTYFEQFVTACEQYDVIHVDGEILSHCSSEQKGRLLKTAVHLCQENVDRWNDVKILLQNSNYSCSSVDKFVTACEEYGVRHVDREILSHCSSQQRDRLLKIAVSIGRWKEVAFLLQDANYSSSSVEQFVTACKQHNVIYVDGEILSHCSSEQKDRLLETAVMTKGWKEVDNLLQDNNYSNSGVEKFITACEQHNVIHVDPEILSRCSSEQRNRLLEIALGTKTWKDVDYLLKDSNFSSSFVEWFITLCEYYGAICVNKDLLSHCTSEQHGRLLERGVRRRRWDRVTVLLQYLHYSSTFVDHLITACEKDHVFPDCPGLLSHCSTQQLDRLLRSPTSLKRLDAHHEGILLVAAGSHEKRVWFIKHACKNANDYDIRPILPHITDDLLSHCNTELLDSLLTKVTRIGRWDIIDKVLRAGGSPAKRVWVIKEACQTADHLNFQSCILPHCDDQLHNQITNPHTQSGLTVLFSAMLNEHYPRIMVAECIRLGFSTHQPPTVMPTPTVIAETITRAWMKGWDNATFSGIITSPFLLAVLRGMPVVAHMLYESGSCSYSQLLHLYTWLLDLSDPHTEDGRKFLQGEYLTEVQRRYSSRLHVYSERNKAFIKTLTTFLPYLREMASTPRSLESSCRLVISHCLYGHGRRNRAVQELPLPEGMKDYLLFSDLTDPDYQPPMYKTMSAALLLQK